MRVALILCFSLTLCLPAAFAADNGSSKESAIPFKRTEEDASTSSLWRVVLSFGAVVALGVGAAYVIRRYIPASVGRAIGGTARIEVLEVRRVTPKLTLFLVHADGERILLTQSGDRITSLQLSPPSKGAEKGLES